MYKEAFKFCALGDVHPNVTTKLIHCSLSYFYLITVTTCDDERENQLFRRRDPPIHPCNDSGLVGHNLNLVSTAKLDHKSYCKEIHPRVNVALLAKAFFSPLCIHVYEQHTLRI